jgi:RNAse (barnase) inhibitor barstar
VTRECDRYPSGIYLIDAVECEQVLRHGAFPASFAIAVLNGTEAATRARFFREIARGLHFPDYFGHNWDAVYDCLTDLNWLPAAGYVLVLDGFEQFATNEPEQWAIALKVLQEACEFWQPLSRSMFVLLRGPRVLAPGVPLLPSACLRWGRGARTRRPSSE